MEKLKKIKIPKEIKRRYILFKTKLMKAVTIQTP